MPKPDFLEQTATELVEWRESTSTKVATRIFSGKPPSGMRRLGPQEKRGYWQGLSLEQKAALWPRLSPEEQQELGPIGLGSLEQMKGVL